jgi:hypothetical protein
MPNWCSNYMTIKPITEDAKKKLHHLYESIGTEINLFNYFVPAPDYYYGESHEFPSDAQYKNLSDFRTNEWGTKWDVQISRNDFIDNEINFSADTAWSPPIAFYQNIEEQGFDVYATFYEPGMCFYGSYSEGECWERKIPNLTGIVSLLLEVQNNDSQFFNLNTIDIDKIKMGDIIETSCGNTFIYVSHKINSIMSLKKEIPELEDKILLEYEGDLDFFNLNENFFEVEVTFNHGECKVKTGVIFTDDLNVIHFSNND